MAHLESRYYYLENILEAIEIAQPVEQLLCKLRTWVSSSRTHVENMSSAVQSL